MGGERIARSGNRHVPKRKVGRGGGGQDLTSTGASLLSLQRSAGNHAVQRLVVQRKRKTKKDDLTLDESDFLPGQGEELDKGFHLLDEEQEGGEQEGTEEGGGEDVYDQLDLESEGVELEGQELDGQPGEELSTEEEMRMRVALSRNKGEGKPGPFAKQTKKLHDKAKRGREKKKGLGGVGWEVLEEIVGLPSGLKAAFREGGAHDHFTQMFDELALAKKWIKEHQLRAAKNLLYGDKFTNFLEVKPRVIKSLANPVLAIRIAMIKAQTKQLRKKLDKEMALRTGDLGIRKEKDVELEESELEGSELS